METSTGFQTRHRGREEGKEEMNAGKRPVFIILYYGFLLYMRKGQGSYVYVCVGLYFVFKRERRGERWKGKERCWAVRFYLSGGGREGQETKGEKENERGTESSSHTHAKAKPKKKFSKDAQGRLPSKTIISMILSSLSLSFSYFPSLHSPPTPFFFFLFLFQCIYY